MFANGLQLGEPWMCTFFPQIAVISSFFTIIKYKIMKILNLYAGLGGNRKDWGDNHQVVAVEMEQKIADVYKANFPNDTVIVGDAHQYLLDIIASASFACLKSFLSKNRCL